MTGARGRSGGTQREREARGGFIHTQHADPRSHGLVLVRIVPSDSPSWTTGWQRRLVGSSFTAQRTTAAEMVLVLVSPHGGIMERAQEPPSHDASPRQAHCRNGPIPTLCSLLYSSLLFLSSHKPSTIAFRRSIRFPDLETSSRRVLSRSSSSKLSPAAACTQVAHAASASGTATARPPIGGLSPGLQRDGSRRQGRLIANEDMPAVGADCGLTLVRRPAFLGLVELVFAEDRTGEACIIGLHRTYLHSSYLPMSQYSQGTKRWQTHTQTFTFTVSNRFRPRSPVKVAF